MFMLPWKLRKSHILPVNQNLSNQYMFSLAKFQLVSCNLSLAMIWQMMYTHKLPKPCSTTLTFLKSPIRTISIKFLLVITTLYKTGLKKWEIASMELSPFSSEVYALLPVLSTLLDNPADSRLWTVSPCLYIRVWYLPDNHQNCYFLYTRFSNHKISNIVHCLSCCENVFP